MSYRDLKVWQMGVDLAVAVYRLTELLPPDERFGLIAQMRRAAVSVPSNIAEGQGRRRRGAFAHHVSIARGSLLELETQLVLLERLGFVDATQIAAVSELTQGLSRMLHGLEQSLEASPGQFAPDSRLPTPD